MKMIKIKTPEGRVYEMPYNKETLAYYNKVNARKKKGEVRFEINVIEPAEAPVSPIKPTEQIEPAEAPVSPAEENEVETKKSAKK